MEWARQGYICMCKEGVIHKLIRKDEREKIIRRPLRSGKYNIKVDHVHPAC